VFGAALLYGDGIVTPAISVLSAVEGLHVATPQLTLYVLPLTVGLLVGLFGLQRRGTARIGRLFGPLMLLWFGVLAMLGGVHVAQHPQTWPTHPFHQCGIKPTGCALNSLYAVCTNSNSHNCCARADCCVGRRRACGRYSTRDSSGLSGSRAACGEAKRVG
jgi:K+ potassium transporter integral membrane domain